MLLNYKFENYLSFRDSVEFSMMAPKTKVKNRFPDNIISTDKSCDILKTAVIVGENAGGKSNFVSSLEYLRALFQENKTAKAYRSCVNANNDRKGCGKDSNTLQIFDLEILSDDGEFYLYHLEMDFIGIVKEEFSYKNEYRKRYRKLLFVHRKKYELSCNGNEDKCAGKNICKTSGSAVYDINFPEMEPEMEMAFENAVKSPKQLGLFISKLAILGNEHAMKFAEWMRDSLCPETNAINYDLYKSLKSEEEDFNILNDPRYMEIFRMIDYSIIDIEIDEEKPFTKSMIIRKKEDGSTFSRELSRDSSGVREYFAWAVQIYKVVYEDKVVFADEMDRVLNPVLSDRVIAFINGKEHHGQFIFTTHNVLHLDLKNYMKEQIYFISKNVESLESELYSLADFPEVRYETTKIYEFYMKGILGGTVIE